MSRIRTIKPEFFLHERLAELSFAHRLLFIGLWTQADRAGRLEDRHRRIKASLMPYDDVDVDQMLTDLDAAGFVVRYQSPDGRRLIEVPTLPKHQHFHVKEADSELPPPSQHHTGTVLESCSHDTSTPGREGKGKEGVSAAQPPSTRPSGQKPTATPRDSRTPRIPPTRTDHDGTARNGPDSPYSRCVAHWFGLYAKAVGQKYLFSEKGDGNSLGRLLKSLDENEIRRRMSIAFEDSWFVAHTPEIRAFCAQANKFAANGKGKANSSSATLPDTWHPSHEPVKPYKPPPVSEQVSAEEGHAAIASVIQGADAAVKTRTVRVKGGP